MKTLRLRNFDIRDTRLPLLLDPNDTLYWILWDPADAFNLSFIDGVGWDRPEYAAANQAWGQEYEKAIVAEAPGVFLMRLGFLRDYACYLRNDWNQMAAIECRLQFEAISREPERAAQNCPISLQCIDGAYWDISVSSEALFESLLTLFPEAEVH